jgi:hypothetical protein
VIRWRHFLTQCGQFTPPFRAAMPSIHHDGVRLRSRRTRFVPAPSFAGPLFPGTEPLIHPTSSYFALGRLLNCVLGCEICGRGPCNRNSESTTADQGCAKGNIVASFWIRAHEQYNGFPFKLYEFWHPQRKRSLTLRLLPSAFSGPP